MPDASKLVLLADDDPLMHRLCQHHLERAGYKMISATTGQEVLDIVKRQVPDIIVLDIMMQKTDGLTALRELKKAQATKDIPVIVVTGAVEMHNAYRRESGNSGASAFLTKPLSPAQLLAEVRRLVPQPAA